MVGKRRGSNRKGMVCITAVVLTLLVAMFVQSNTLKAKNDAYAQQEITLNQQIEEENQRTEDIAKLEEYMKTQEFAEDVARDRLGLVYNDEVLFKAEN